MALNATAFLRSTMVQLFSLHQNLNSTLTQKFQPSLPLQNTNVECKIHMIRCKQGLKLKLVKRQMRVKKTQKNILSPHPKSISDRSLG